MPEAPKTSTAAYMMAAPAKDVLIQFPTKRGSIREGGKAQIAPDTAEGKDRGRPSCGRHFLTFAQVLLSLELFLLSPYARRHVRRFSVAGHVALTAAMTAAAAGLLAAVSPAATAVFLAAVVAVTFAAPAALVRGHKFKAKISGPWDEAAPCIPRELIRLPLTTSVSLEADAPGRALTHE